MKAGRKGEKLFLVERLLQFFTIGLPRAHAKIKGEELSAYAPELDPEKYCLYNFKKPSQECSTER